METEQVRIFNAQERETGGLTSGPELRRSSEKLFNKWPRQKRRNISAAGTAAIRARNLYAQAWRQVQFQGNTNHPVPATNDAAFRLQQELLRVALDYVEALDAIVRLQNSGHMHRRASRTWAVRRADGVSHLAINVGKAVDRYRNALRLPEARPEGVGWFGGWDPIGKGGFGAARVFVRQNAEAEIVNVSSLLRLGPGCNGLITIARGDEGLPLREQRARQGVVETSTLLGKSQRCPNASRSQVTV